MHDSLPSGGHWAAKGFHNSVAKNSIEKHGDTRKENVTLGNIKARTNGTRMKICAEFIGLPYGKRENGIKQST
jgi:hypothetical protein